MTSIEKRYLELKDTYEKLHEECNGEKVKTYYVRGRIYAKHKFGATKFNVAEFEQAITIFKIRIKNKKDLSMYREASLNDIDKLPTRKVCFFTVKDGKYLAENGMEITTEMLVKYPHHINDAWSFIVLD